MLPEHSYRSRQMPLYTESTLPDTLTTRHSAPAGTSVKITVLAGGVRCEYFTHETDTIYTSHTLTE